MTKINVISEAGTLHFHFMGDYSKHDRVKMMGARGKINAIWWNVKINLQKLVDICGYELPTNLQHFVRKRLNRREDIPKSFRGLLFLKHPVVLHRITWSWYTGRWWVDSYIWFSEEETEQSRSLPRPLLAVPNVTAHPSTASVPITVLTYNCPLLCSFNVPLKGQYAPEHLQSAFLSTNQQHKCTEGITITDACTSKKVRKKSHLRFRHMSVEHLE